MAELDRGEDEARAEDGALSFSLSPVKLVKSQTGCLTITLRYPVKKFYRFRTNGISLQAAGGDRVIDQRC
eukprot:SAG11_NODE_814_length_7033_cov_57.557254_2_plen_70_part_00